MFYTAKYQCENKGGKSGPTQELPECANLIKYTQLPCIFEYQYPKDDAVEEPSKQHQST